MKQNDKISKIKDNSSEINVLFYHTKKPLVWFYI